MAGRRICAGYYRRYDSKVAYVISTATDADTGEETVIWTAYPFADVPKYCTSSKSPSAPSWKWTESERPSISG